MVKKFFNSFGELLDFDFQLEPSCSNYLILKPEDGVLPAVNKESSFKDWRVISRSDRDSHPKITMELTPEWLTIIIYDGKSKKKQDINVRIAGKSPKTLIQEIFEY